MPLKLVKKGKIWHITGTVNGRRYRESAGTASREHAEAIRKTTERDLEDRAYLKAATFADAVSFYLEKGGEGLHLQPLMDRFEAVQLKDITPAAVSEFSTQRYGHLEPSSIKRCLYTPINAVMRKAYEANYCPLIRFAPPKVKRKPIDYADDQWLRTFLEYAHHRIALVVLFLTLTGTRVSEACRLTVGDIDLARSTAILRITKNGKSRRVILPGQLTEAIARWIGEQRLVDPVTSLFGYAARWSVNQAIERVCIKAGIPIKSSHKVGRHAFAARLLAEGKGLKFVQEAGGWAGIQIVAEAYGHLEGSAIDNEVRASGDAMITKMGSSSLLLSPPQSSGHENGTSHESDSLIDAIRDRHPP